jgi:Uma2 family endonuclease
MQQAEAGMATVAQDDPDVENGVYYPCSDGKPMAETDMHWDAIALLKQALEDYFESTSDVYVSSDIYWFWEEGNPKARRAPDVFIVRGVEKKKRRSFRSWNESGAIPCVCFETLSAKTWKRNLGAVKDDYETQGVREYFLFDPTRQYVNSGLLGFRLRGGKYRSIRADRDGSMTSAELGLRMAPEGDMLRLIDATTGTAIPTRAERASALVAEVERLKAQLRKASKSGNGAK